MLRIKQRAISYIIGKPNNIPASATEVNLDELADEINRLDQQAINELGVDSNNEKKRSTNKVLRKLSTKKGQLESLVVELDEDVKKQLIQRHKNTLIIEADEPIFPIDTGFHENTSVSLLQNSMLTSDTEKLVFTIFVKDVDGKSINNARVIVSGTLWVDQGFTDKKGKVKLTLIGETEESISSIAIKPAHTFWSLRIDKPQIIVSEDNEIVLKKIDDVFSGDKNKNTSQYVGWGQQDMKLDILPRSTKTAKKKIKVVVIDSGISAEHSDLSPKNGFDFDEAKDPKNNWKKDGSGHGTHVAGICSAQNNEFGILGFSPDSELMVLRIFPNASNSKLIGALDWCIDQEVDVINMSLGGKKASELIQQRLQACRENGILPIAAAGNNGGSVLYPAAFEEVLCVAAIGRYSSFPEDSSHQKHIGSEPIQSGQYFSPEFTCRGPEVDVCAPGVAIVSTVPGDGYAAWDGTSMACPHVTGFAARLLRLSDNIFSLPRTAKRSQVFYDAILNHCQFLDGIPSDFQGRGLPILPVENSKKSKNDEHDLKRIAELIREAISVIESQEL